MPASPRAPAKLLPLFLPLSRDYAGGAPDARGLSADADENEITLHRPQAAPAAQDDSGGGDDARCRNGERLA